MNSQTFEASDDEHNDDGISNPRMKEKENLNKTVNSSENGSVKPTSNLNLVHNESLKTITLDSQNPSRIITPKDTNIKNPSKKSKVEDDSCKCIIF